MKSLLLVGKSCRWRGVACAILVVMSCLVAFGAGNASTAVTPEVRLQREFGDNVAAYRAADAKARTFIICRVSGSISSRSSTALTLWGTVTCYGATPSYPGWLLDEGNIAVRNFNPRGVFFNDYSGDHVYVGESTGKNAYGATVPVKVYGPIPQAYQDAVTLREGARLAALDAQVKLINLLRQTNTRKVQAAPQSGQALAECGTRCLTLSRFFAERGFPADDVAEEAVTYYAKAATAFYQAGAAAQGVTFTVRAFQTAKPGGSADADAATWATGVLDRNPKIVTSLVAAMATVMPQYLPTVQGDAADTARRSAKWVYMLLPDDESILRCQVLEVIGAEHWEAFGIKERAAGDCARGAVAYARISDMAHALDAAEAFLSMRDVTPVVPRPDGIVDFGWDRDLRGLLVGEISTALVPRLPEYLQTASEVQRDAARRVARALYRELPDRAPSKADLYLMLQPVTTQNSVATPAVVMSPDVPMAPELPLAEGERRNPVDGAIMVKIPAGEYVCGYSDS